jgi:AraC-like DNA-binding protein
MTHSKQTEPRAARDFQALFAQARSEVVDGPGDLREVQLALDGPPLLARTRKLTSGGFIFVRGENLAQDDLLLRNEASAPMVAIHAPLRGSAENFVDGLGAAVADRVGTVQVFASPTSHSTVRLRAGVRNEAFRITIAPAVLADLASRHRQLEPIAARVASSVPFCGPAVAASPLRRLLDDVTDILDSAHYGALRPLFLESRALGWLAMAMVGPRDSEPDRLTRREVDRMHEAHDLLRERLANPPTLAEVARAIATNEFALKRNFKKVFGQPVYQHLLTLRLAHARQQLCDTDLTIKQVAKAVGYAHTNHFGTAFRRIYGISPARYRANKRS